MDAASAISNLQAIQSSLSILTALQLTSYKYPPSASFDNELTFDYVVVGAGTAGSVLAARLTEDPDVTVALIEAGGDPTFEAEMPGLFALEPRMEYDYNFLAENDNFTCQHAQGKIAQMTAGKLLGGTSGFIHMPYLRGSPEDYDRWSEATGDDTWNYNNLLPYFIKIERMEDCDILNSETANLHGTEGPLGLTREPNDMNANYIKSMEEIGFEYNLDVTGKPFGVSDPLLLNSRGVKQTIAEGYLSPVKDRKNLFVYKDTVVTKILFDDEMIAIGVEALSSDNQTHTFQVIQEVILSAGAIKSPQLLMLSGVGPQEHLSEFGIPVVSDLPVGKNLRDRAAVTFAYKMQACNITVPPADPHKFPVPVTLGLKALNESQTVPDFQIFGLVFPHDQLSGLTMVSSFSLKYENAITDRFIEANTGHEFFMGVVNSKYPKSTGEVLLRSTNPFDQPKIYLGILSQSSDVEDLGRYLMYMSRLAQTSHFKNVGAEFVVLDLPECDGFEADTLDYWNCYAVAMSIPFWQSMSTCSMGSVVDSHLRVNGVCNLRVVDISVLPYFDSGEPLPAAVAVAEKAADLIKQSRH